ncbi:SpoIIE family protein phosphatase [Streptomyces sp. Ag109_O5-10]|uniref:SpoIIE family protein phosphatase n=1 Tax=Streptomyces sp. Ag109_O5-10 TaxID=1855349 RepID=UPI000897FF68|nr:SpoIIE family protein phosphatase [Streptomyces sp. Ag109_O5-10]SEF05374.1 Serine phosphatase RsbU, regulator of sigma subunit [Streptomyces sp. Ag109_O5-10]
MDGTADGLVFRAAHALAPRADELITDVTRCLRAEVPELWEDPELTRMTSENIAEHVAGVLGGLEAGLDPRGPEPPPGDVDHARRLARRGVPVTVMLRAHRLAEGVLLDSLLAELPRLTDDPGLVDAVARRLLALSTRYVDRIGEQSVLAFQEERDRRLQWRMSLVNEAGLRVGTALDIARTTQELADLAAEDFADLVTVDLLDSVVRGHTPRAAERYLLRRVAQGTYAPGGAPEPSVKVQELHSCPDGSPVARALVTGRPARQTSADLATLVVPLTARGTTLGVARFCRHRDPARFDDEDLVLAQEIAARAAVAVDSACRYTHARATALTLQRSLLPRRTAEQSAAEVACRYLPAGGRAGVGGDWYDVIPLSGARVALVVGDVVGHGIHAAATMGRLRTAVRTLADIDLPPDELLTHLDDVVIRLSAEAAADPDPDPGRPRPAVDSGPDLGPDLGPELGPGPDPGAAPAGDIGATCLYAVHDPVAGRCSLARAGHVLPTVVHRDGTAAVLDLPPGPPLGLGGLPFEAVEADLPEGSLLALYTDGLLEGRDGDVEAGLAALREVLARPAASLETACDTVLQALLPTDRPHDDVALLLVRPRTLGADRVTVWDLEPAPTAVAPARAAVARQLTAWDLEDLAFAAELVVSELVTNAIRYGSPPVRLRLILPRTPGRPGDGPARAVLCEVSDAGGTVPHLRRARTFDEGGRGLLLVAQLAARWGTRHARHGKTVWAELTETGPPGFPDLTADL